MNSGTENTVSRLKFGKIGLFARLTQSVQKPGREVDREIEVVTKRPP
jgi:hypothetical protein